MQFVVCKLGMFGMCGGVVVMDYFGESGLGEVRKGTLRTMLDHTHTHTWEPDGGRIDTFGEAYLGGVTLEAKCEAGSIHIRF